MKILIVEDDKVLSLLISRMVQKMDHNVIETVTKGADAIQTALKEQPDLILMDIMLEDDIDGIDAMLEIRQKKKELPVIFITGNSDPYNKERAQETNFIDYLIKPVNYQELKNSIDKI